MITTTINGKKITLEKPMTILQAAKMNEIEIPTLCHHEILEPYGGCRLCLVEVEKMPRLQTACTQYVTDGMIVWTETEKVVEARRGILEFLLINHPLDCPYCDKAGECDLQDLVVKYGPITGRFVEGKRKHPESYDDPLIVRNMERCISCTRCVRMCDKVQGASAISMVNRSSQTFVEPFSGKRYDCEYCGNCLTVCPVGAIMSRLHRHAYRPWMIEKEVDTVCSFCGVGCSMVLQVRNNSIVRVVPEIGKGLNKGLLCSRGRFGYDYAGSSKRLKTPLIRRNGKLQEVTWADALTFIAQNLTTIKEKYGSKAIAGVASGRYTNEDNYVFQKFIRVVLGSNNIDSAAGLAYAPAQKFFEGIFGQGVTANSIYGISNSDGVFVIGSDPTSVNPVLGLQIREAHQQGIPVVTIGYMPGLKRFATNSLIPNQLTETILLAALFSGLSNKKSPPEKRSPLDDIIKNIQPITFDEAERCCRVLPGEIIGAVDVLSGMTNPSIIIGRDIIQKTEGHTNLLLLAALAHILNGRIYLLSELPNEQGLIDMGCQPDMLPGGNSLIIESFKKRYEEFFGMDVPSVKGLNLVEMIEGMHHDKIRAVYSLGENIAFNIPGSKYVRDAINKLEFLVVHDTFLTETAQLADVVLPSLSWAEKEGTFTNLERKIQLLRKAVDGHGSKNAAEDWRIFAEISKLMGFEMDYKTSADVMTEIASVSPLHKGITYEDIANSECIWPYNSEPTGYGVSIKGIGLPDVGSLLKKSDKDRVYVGIYKSLFHSESLSRNSAALAIISPKSYVMVNKILADRLSIAEGDYISISTDTGTAELPAQIDANLPENIILIPNNFEGKGVFEFMNWKINPAVGSPAMDTTEATVKKIKSPAQGELA